MDKDFGMGFVVGIRVFVVRGGTGLEFASCDWDVPEIFMTLGSRVNSKLLEVRWRMACYLSSTLF